MLKAYASYFVSYLLNNINKKNIGNIDRIVLFGSVARDEATKDSDIDLFIEIKNKSKAFEMSKFHSFITSGMSTE